jgi:hypothetical protein
VWRAAWPCGDGRMGVRTGRWCRERYGEVWRAADFFSREDKIVEVLDNGTVNRINKID